MAITSQELIAAIKELADQAEFSNINTTRNISATTEELEKQLDLQKQSLEAQVRIAQIFQDENATIAARKELFENELALAMRRGDIDKEQMQRLIDGDQASIAAAAERLGLEEEILKQKQMQFLEDQKSLQIEQAIGRETGRYAKELGEFLGINVRMQDTFLGKTISIAEKLKDNSEFQQQFIRDLKETFSVQNLALSALTKIGEVTLSFVKSADKARASLAQATGLGFEFTGVMIDAQREANLLGVSMEDAGKAIGSLVSGTTDFVNMSRMEQDAIVGTTVRLGRLNVSTDESAKLLQNLTQALGLSTMGANDLTVSLATMGLELGINAAQMIQDFNQSLSVLAVYGDQAPKIFTKLAAAAKVAGVEVSSLLSLAGRFDTFQSAAETVAQLNAVLGTQLSTTQMLLATEEDRIEMLIESIQMGDMQFDQLDRFTQKAVAASVGITDMSEANKIFGMSLGEYQKYSKQMERSADAQAKLDKAVAATVPVFDKFKVMISELALAIEPTLKGLGYLADSITGVLQGMDEDTKQIIVTTLAVVAAFTTLAAVLGPLLSAFATFAALIGSGGLAVGFGAIGAAIVPVLAGVVLLGGAIALVSYGLSKLSNTRASASMTSSIQRNVTERTNGLSRSAGNSAMNNALASVTSKQGDTVIEKVLVNVGRDQFVGTVQGIVQKENAGRTYT
jgi:hypothetical protein